MPDVDTTSITSWHAHVYFDASTRDVAWALRQVITERLGAVAKIGHFHERPVGPHPMGSFQIELPPHEFANIVAWLALIHAPLDVFVHPNTGEELRDHRDSAIWIGRSHTLKLEALG